MSAVELVERVRTPTGLRLGNGTAAMFLSAWLEACVVVELSPARFALSAEGERLAAGMLDVEREEAA